MVMMVMTMMTHYRTVWCAHISIEFLQVKAFRIVLKFLNDICMYHSAVVILLFLNRSATNIWDWLFKSLRFKIFHPTDIILLF